MFATIQIGSARDRILPPAKMGFDHPIQKPDLRPVAGDTTGNPTGK
jgi:hypothetical protein